MRRCVSHGLVPRAGGAVAVPLSLTPLCTTQRTAASIGGKASPPGFSGPQGKAPRIKQGTSRDVPQRIPGTTKVRYTNNKGRTFTFSIPVSQLTHPPVLRRGSAATGWREIDTSFSDVGDLEEDMPTELDERLTAVGVSSDDGVVVEVDAAQLRGLQEAFVQLCKDYVLMDTAGMKTSMMYSELNNGPDYEHYDRKTRRRRHWIALRHRFEDVRELLWPADAAAELRTRGGVASSTAPPAPLLSVPAMMEALSWAEAASTFAVRTHRPYDTAEAADFTPLELSREVHVVAECVGVVGPRALGADPSIRVDGWDEEPATLTASTDAAVAAADRLISFAALCTNHHVPLSIAFNTDRSIRDSGSSTSSADTAAATAWLASLPALSRVKDALRTMAVLQSMDEAAVAGTPSSMLQFSNEHGEVTDAMLLQALCRLVSPSLFPHAASLENVDETELCVLMRLVAEMQEQNGCFLRDTRADGTAERQVLHHLTQLAITRCRQLLYKTDGPRTSLLSGDTESIPLVDLQAFAEHNHPAVRVHTKVGEANAQGLRYARLQSPASATLAQLLRRLESANGRLATSTHGLRGDLLHHIAHKTALGKDKLTLADVTRALPLLADAMRQTSEAETKAEFDRLFAAMGISIGVGLQQPQKASTVLDLLDGLARCHYTPSSYRLLEMVTLRLVMQGACSLSETARALVAMLQIVGPHGVSQSVQQAVAMRVVAAIERCNQAAAASSSSSATSSRSEVWSALRALRFSLYPSFPSLLLLVTQSPLAANTQSWPAVEHVQYAVLLTAAAGRLSPSEEDAAVALSLSNTARAELQLGFQADHTSTTGKPSVLLGGGEDAHQECLVTCAALQLDASPPVLHTWAHATREGRCLHSLCTPLLGVSTLAAMEALQLAPSSWYAAYDAYVTQALEQMQANVGGLLEDDAQTAERVLSLSAVSRAARAAATAVLTREVERLDAVLTDGSTTAAMEGTAAEPVFTFQQSALNREAETAVLEERLLRYCTALQRQSAESDAAAP